MESALIVSYVEKSNVVFADMLRSVSCDQIMTTATCGEARRILVERDFDLCLINSPLRDETGEALARDIAMRGMGQVLLAVKSELYNEVAQAVEDYGVITIAKPINRSFFWSALKMAKASQTKLRAMREENCKLTRKIEDIRVVDRAKCTLISYLNMREADAHKYIEKQAMDMRMTKRAVAEAILKMYEN